MARAKPILVFHSILSAADPLLGPWLALYDRAFPPEEKIPVSEHLEALTRPDPKWKVVLLAALDEAGTLAGMARYESGPGVAYLPYLAVNEACRGAGLGSVLYEEVLRRLRNGDLPGLVFEVERPDHAHGETGVLDAERRIRFYQRLGARLLRGIRYLQEVPGQPPVPMHLMIHPFRPLGAEEALALARRLFEVEETGEPLTLE